MKINLNFEIDDEKNESIRDVYIYLYGPKFFSSLNRITNIIRSRLDQETFPIDFQNLLERILDESQEHLNEVD